MFLANLSFVLLAALVGGLTARIISLPTIIGYILAGVIFSSILPFNTQELEGLAEFGIILLLFSVGIELSFNRLTRLGIVAVIGAVVQILAVTAISFIFLSILGLDPAASLVLSTGFSLSSTALVVKLLEERGETASLHGNLMIAWLLVQDLAVIPIVVLLPALVSGGTLLVSSFRALVLALILVLGTIFLGKIVIPFLVHKVASVNSRELLALTAISLALVTALFASLFGISAALGAFLAGLVISETQENHAIFAETRPLRDMFVILFFVTLGFLVTPQIIVTHFWLILTIVIFILAVKFFVLFLLSNLLLYKGRTALFMGIGLSQVGEFSFVIFLAAKKLNIITGDIASIGAATTLATFVVTPILFRSIIPVWRRLKMGALPQPRKVRIDKEIFYKDHIIICGFGRVGKWIGHAFNDAGITYLVIDYNQVVVKEVRDKGIPVIFGDPAESEVLEYAGIRKAKGIIITVPDRIAQEEIISYVQTVNPDAKIISRANLDEDWERLNSLKVRKVVQPEFEASVAIIREIFLGMGKSKEEIAQRIKYLKQEHTLKR